MNNDIEARECQTCRSIGLVLAAMIVGLISYYVEKSYPIWVAVVAFLVLLAFGMWLVNRFCGTVDISAEPAAKTKATPTLAEPVLTTPQLTAVEPAAEEVAPVSKVSEPVIESGGSELDGDAQDEGIRPEILTSARNGKADDLKKIKGVGPKLEKTMNAMGFYHFDQLASWNAQEVAWVDENLEGFKGRVTRDDWVKQAKTLAAGGNTAFSKKVDKGDVY